MTLIIDYWREWTPDQACRGAPDCVPFGSPLNLLVFVLSLSHHVGTCVLFICVDVSVLCEPA